MKCPVLANWIRFKRVSEDEYLIVNLLLDEQTKTDAYTVWFAKHLDGKTDPFEIDPRLSYEEVVKLLDYLSDKDVIRDKRFLSKFFLYLLITVWHPKVTLNLKVASFIINATLMVSWLPLLIFAVYYAVENIDNFNVAYVLVGSAFGLIIGSVAHELGHMFACLGYGGRVFEVGICFYSFMPGAYVLMNERNIKNRFRRVQINAAGIEMNLLLSAIFLILGAEFEIFSGYCLGFVIQNLLLAVGNLLFISGFDGMAILSELIGVEDISAKAKNITGSRLKRRKLANTGAHGGAAVAACYIVRVLQLALPLILIINIVGVVLCFI